MLPIFVMRVGVPPLTGIVQRSRPADSRDERNAIVFPSGDQRELLSALGQSVRRLAAPPSAGAIQMSGLPARRDVNEICVQSREQNASLSMPGSPLTRCDSPPVVATTQMSSSP